MARLTASETKRKNIPEQTWLLSQGTKYKFNNQ